MSFDPMLQGQDAAHGDPASSADANDNALRQVSVAADNVHPSTQYPLLSYEMPSNVL